MKKIDFTKNVFDLTEEYPELIEILKSLGFLGVANPIARKTLGKATTIPAGCKKMRVDLQEVIKNLEEKGFVVENYE